MIPDGTIIRARFPLGVRYGLTLPRLGEAQLDPTPSTDCWFEGDPPTHVIEMEDEGLEVVGPEKPTADMKRCGAGRGAECCIFLLAGPGGLQCGRTGGLRYMLLSRQPLMRAQRIPGKIFPGCQLP